MREPPPAPPPSPSTPTTPPQSPSSPPSTSLSPPRSRNRKIVLPPLSQPSPPQSPPVATSTVASDNGGSTSSAFSVGKDGLPPFHCCTSEDVFFDTTNRFLPRKGRVARVVAGAPSCTGAPAEMPRRSEENLNAVTGPADVESWLGGSVAQGASVEDASDSESDSRHELHATLAGLQQRSAARRRALPPAPRAAAEEEERGGGGLTRTATATASASVASGALDSSAAEWSDAGDRRTSSERLALRMWSRGTSELEDDDGAEDHWGEESGLSTSVSTASWTDASSRRHTRKDVRVAVARARRTFSRRGLSSDSRNSDALGALLGCLLARYIGAVIGAVRPSFREAAVEAAAAAAASVSRHRRPERDRRRHGRRALLRRALPPRRSLETESELSDPSSEEETERGGGDASHVRQSRSAGDGDAFTEIDGPLRGADEDAGDAAASAVVRSAYEDLITGAGTASDQDVHRRQLLESYMSGERDYTTLLDAFPAARTLLQAMMPSSSSSSPTSTSSSTSSSSCSVTSSDASAEIAMVLPP